MDSKEIIFWNFKSGGGFPQYKDYEEYQNRDKKEEPKIVKSEVQKKIEEIQDLKNKYNPKPTDPKELKKWEEERMEREDKDWREKNLLTDEHRRRFDSWGGKERPIKKVNQKKLDEIAKDNADSQANFNKFVGKSIL